MRFWAGVYNPLVAREIGVFSQDPGISTKMVLTGKDGQKLLASAVKIISDMPLDIRWWWRNEEERADSIPSSNTKEKTMTYNLEGEIMALF